MTAAKEKSTLLVKDKDVVTPGEVLAEGMEYLPSQGTYRKG
jgi:exosome complex RNA-binding protein Csl4